MVLSRDTVSEAPPKDTVTNAKATSAKRGTQTVPDAQRGGVQQDDDRAKALLLYGTDSIYQLSPRKSGMKYYELGSDPAQDIVISSPYVSARQCRLYPTRSGLKVVDSKSKNGTYFEGKRRTSFEVEPGRTFFVGARLHQLVVLNEPMRASYPALAAILGYEDEHVIHSETPSPSELIVAAVDGPHMLITSESNCEQGRLAQIIHEISLLRDRTLIPFDHASGRQELESDLLQHCAATVLLDLSDNRERISPTLTARLFSLRYQTRLIALASAVDIANAALGERYVRKMKHIWLEPLSGRAKAIQRLLDMEFRALGADLRFNAMSAHNQAALRNYRWPDNFGSLRVAARRLLAIAQAGTLRGAARALQMDHGTLTNWYREQVRLELRLLESWPDKRHASTLG